MERKATNKAFKLAAYLCLLTVLLRGAAVEACQQEDQDCSSLACCEGLECVEVSPGVFQCEPECCEEHADHECTVHQRECCDHDTFELTCDCNVTEGFCKEYTKRLGEVCDRSTDICARRAECQDVNGTDKCKCNDVCTDQCDCCVNAVCTTLSDGTKECRCNKREGDLCNPSACVPECCELECVATTPGGSEFKCM